MNLVGLAQPMNSRSIQVGVTDTIKDERWTASYYFTAVDVHLSLDLAWEKLLNYRAWNPSFEGATVTVISGSPNTVGERVLIGKTSELMDGEPVPQFYAETIVLDHRRRQVVWYVYPTRGRLFRNFVDFRLVFQGDVVRFEISYCEQNQLEGAALHAHRIAYDADLQALAHTFKAHCERRSTSDE